MTILVVARIALLSFHSLTMQVVVVVTTAAGIRYNMLLSRRATVFEVKRRLRRDTGIAKSRQQLLLDSTPLDNDVVLHTVAEPEWPDWCVIQDVATIQSGISLVLCLTLESEPGTCAHCRVSSPSVKLCCGAVVYCNPDCQLLGWRSHKVECVRRQRRCPIVGCRPEWAD